jgi:hypothetical protein
MLRVKLLMALGRWFGFTVLQGSKIAMIENGNVVWFIDRNRVNLNDLCSRREDGKIVRCDGDPRECVMACYIPKRGQ